MRILVTGLNGFTGQYLKTELENHGHQVIGLTCNLMERDIVLTEIALIRPEAVIHLAAVSFVGHSNITDFYKINILGTYHLLSALAQHDSNIYSIMLVSSATVYKNTNQKTLTETSPTDPLSDYAVSKLAMEHMAKLWMGRLPIFIVRPFNYTGVGQNENFLISKIITHFKNKSPTIELGNLNVWREFGDVRVVAEIYRKLIEHGPTGKTINVCTNKVYSLLEVLALVKKISRHEIKIKINSKFVRKNEIIMLKGDNSLLKSLVPDCSNIVFKKTLEWMLHR